jgi:hypothetical protein
MENCKEIFLGNSLYKQGIANVKGEIIVIDGEEYYKISNFLSMPSFFMTVVSDSDHWMYVSSFGGLTCGRRNPDSALFPYITDDKIHDASANTGPKTIILLHTTGKTFLWEPFEIKHKGVYQVEQNLYKSIYGNKILFEEINHDLKSAFSYRWMNSDKYGFVRESRIINLDRNSRMECHIIDGIRNILPYGINRNLQANMSTLVDGYKKCEVDESTGLGLFTLSAIMTDKAEPSEALKATTVWQSGLTNPEILLSADQIDNFLAGEKIFTEKSLKGRRGSYFVSDIFKIDSGACKNWYLMADLNQGPSEVVKLNHQINDIEIAEILKDIRSGTEKLKLKVSAADGFQHTADSMVNCRHYSNTLFNIMRGGIFNHGYTLYKDDLINFIQCWNKIVFERNCKFLSSLSEQEIYPEILEKVRTIDDPDLERIILEYLPLTFGRRHGDPSRPWNLFSIDIKRPDGSENIYYQGNWRDIFQNWHALSLSYPEFIESFIVKFMNASTPDGYNPYRITNDGFDWEVPDPDDPWSNIGYWGDHQVIYLLNLMELSVKYHPGLLDDFLTKEIFVFANIPYRIKGYSELIADPRNTVDYDYDLDKTIRDCVNQIGSDGKLCLSHDGATVKVNLTEKILISLLAKISNFVPGGGIWMSTQRPEWNDANNALVGYGLSMVTLYNLYRYLNFIIDLFQNLKQKNILISAEVADLFESVNEIFETHAYLLNGKISDMERKEFMDKLGKIGETYRIRAYSGFSGLRTELDKEKLLEFFRLSRLYLYQTIKLNRRPDGLYHSYNLIQFQPDGYPVEYLYEMLEGQVAVLGSGYLSPDEGAELLDSLRQSKMYQPDQKSYMLYPDRELPSFLEKNNLLLKEIRKSSLLLKELKQQSTKYIEVDIEGNFHFNGIYRNSAELRQALEKEPGLESKEIEFICELYFELFKHKSFTGRSGTFYKYEGLGCIYWHMVSKLELAVQELWVEALKRNTKKQVLNRIHAHYSQIKEGHGAGKSPAEYGAFPMDPYSHTPGFAGAQQPGMTGQVKEDFISRFGELGVLVQNGQISFNPTLLSREEFIKQPCNWEYYRGKEKLTLKLEKDTLVFMLCGIPIIYVLSEREGIEVEFTDGKKRTFDTDKIDNETSRMVFRRNNEIRKLSIKVRKNSG